jgi:hypothetical protein
MPKRSPAITPSMTGGLQAQRVTMLPRSWPVQRNLLQLFGGSLWMVRLPPGLESRIKLRRVFHAEATAFGLRGWRGSVSGPSGWAGSGAARPLTGAVAGET